MMLTSTVYTCVVPSAAVTVYVTGSRKSWRLPLSGVTLMPVNVMFGSSACTSVPYGMASVICVPLMSALISPTVNAVMSLASLGATLTITR